MEGPGHRGEEQCATPDNASCAQHRSNPRAAVPTLHTATVSRPAQEIVWGRWWRRRRWEVPYCTNRWTIQESRTARLSIGAGATNAQEGRDAGIVGIFIAPTTRAARTLGELVSGNPGPPECSQRPVVCTIRGMDPAATAWESSGDPGIPSTPRRSQAETSRRSHSTCSTCSPLRTRRRTSLRSCHRKPRRSHNLHSTAKTGSRPRSAKCHPSQTGRPGLSSAVPRHH